MRGFGVRCFSTALTSSALADSRAAKAARVGAGLKAGAEHARESAGAAGEMVEEFIKREGARVFHDCRHCTTPKPD